MNALPTIDFSGGMFGLPVALLLLLVAVLLLPSAERKRARQGAVLLGISFVCGLLHKLLIHEVAVEELLLFSSTFCLLASIGRSVVLLVLDVVVERRTARPTPRIFRDLSTGIIYLIVGLAALRTVGFEPGSILTTSALLTAVLGLAMQDTLGNLVSGLALQMQPPFDVGDWIEVDSGAQAGRVTEVTWRATTVMTLDHVEVILPNASLAKAAIRNYSRPSTISRRRVVVGVTYSAPPDEVHDALVSAARDVPGVLESPAPSSRTRAFADSSIEYELFFYIDDFGAALRTEGLVRDRVYYALARGGLEIPYPTRTLVSVPEGDPARRTAEGRARCLAAISATALAQPLPDDARQLLADRAELRLYGKGEAVVRKGDPSHDFYLIDTGYVAIEVERTPSGAPGVGSRRPPAEVAQLGPGQCFGERGLLTGEARSATVRAKTACRLVVVGHAAFHDVLASHPEVVERMGLLLASRQAELEAAENSAIADQPPEERSRRLISQIREFFKLV